MRICQRPAAHILFLSRAAYILWLTICYIKFHVLMPYTIDCESAIVPLAYTVHSNFPAAINFNGRLRLRYVRHGDLPNLLMVYIK